MLAKRPVIFVVEDEPVSAELIQIYFEELGYEVLVAHSAAEAAALAVRRDPDILITDMLLDGPESGLSVARRFREQYPELPIMLTSGLPQDDIRAAVAEIPGVHALPKPVRLSGLRETIDGLLREVAADGAGRPDGVGKADGAGKTESTELL
ncbi:MAG: response regulator transcription factor [Gemmatimonadota bacterium]